MAMMNSDETKFCSTFTCYCFAKFLKTNCEGPEVRGTRPVLVTFENFKDRDEVLRKVSELSQLSKKTAILEWNNPNPGVT